jgi:hypothetical protein
VNVKVLVGKKKRGEDRPRIANECTVKENVDAINSREKCQRASAR